MSDTGSLGELGRYVSDVTRRVLWIAAGLSAACLGFRPDDPSLALGVVLGSAFSIIRFRVRASNLTKFAEAAPGQQKRTLIRGHMVAYVLAGIAIGIAVASVHVHTVAAIASLFLVNAVVIVMALVHSGERAEA